MGAPLLQWERGGRFDLVEHRVRAGGWGTLAVYLSRAHLQGP